MADLSPRLVFPPEIFATSERPDLVFYSREKRKVFLVELTCPAEEGIEAANMRKLGRYSVLQSINASKVWSAELFTLEVGARGFVALSVSKFLRKLGLPSRKVRHICKRLSTIVVRCSYAIFLSQDIANWSKQPLFELPEI